MRGGLFATPRPAPARLIPAVGGALVLLVALPVFLLAGLPMLGYAAGAVAWVIQRALQIFLNRKAMVEKDPRKVAGIVVGSMIGRVWLAALTIFAAGLEDNDA